jgi:hypothetical protein
MIFMLDIRLMESNSAAPASGITRLQLHSGRNRTRRAVF